MIISALWHVDGLCTNFPDLFDLDLEMRLIQVLQKTGYTILYKVHPDGLNRHINFHDYFGSNVVIVRKSFEETMDRADAFVFYFCATTTFPWAMLSNKPVIYINCDDGEQQFRNAFALVRKRCAVIEGEFDERNRFIFDQTALLQALAVVPKEPNTEFMEKYMFPTGVTV